MAPEGIPFLVWSFASGVFLYLVNRCIHARSSKYTALGIGSLLILIAQFFRDPERFTSAGARHIIAPADGKVLEIEQDNLDSNDDFPKKISIYMSLFNVHINRSPVGGKILSIAHYDGKFLSAFNPQASRENEHTMVMIDTPYGTVGFSQVAGLIARRIKFYAREGWKLSAGQRVGMIRFGSRVDLYLPQNVSFHVRPGDNVRAGETIIGEFYE